MRILRLIFFLLAILVGVAAGLYFGWVLSPPRPGQGSLTTLRQDYHTDYVLMVAETFQSEGDVGLAADRLSRLGTETPARLAQQAILAARDLNYSIQDVETLAKLSQALLTWKPTAAGGTK